MKPAYFALCKLNELREGFVFDLLCALSSDKSKARLKDIWTIIHQRDFYDFQRHSRYSDKHRFEKERFEVLKEKYKDLSLDNSENLKLSPEAEALIDKVRSMTFDGDLPTVLRMLYSFRFGTKRLTSNQNNQHEGQYSYTDKDGNLKLSHKGNLPKAHFRWNQGNRYILNDADLKKIETFLGAIFPPDIHYNTKKR